MACGAPAGGPKQGGVIVVMSIPAGSDKTIKIWLLEAEKEDAGLERR